MSEEDKKDEVIEDTEEKEEEGDLDDKGGENEEEEDKGKEEEDQDDEIDLDKVTPETRRQREEKKEEEEEDEIDPEDQKRISKIVDQKIGNKLTEIENKAEVQAFVAAKPEFSKYQGVILKYMSHPDYANIPVHNIAAIVASKDMMKIGAAKERAAQGKVDKTKSPGTTVRKQEGGGKDWHTASKEDFEAQRNKVLGRQGF